MPSPILHPAPSHFSLLMLYFHFLNMKRELLAPGRLI
jgi:hypothetical protein